MTTDADAILIGGPRGETVLNAGDAGLIEIEIDGTIHRYIRTKQQRRRDSAELTVYNYDGEIAPHGGEAGTENPAARVASPLAAGKATELPAEGAAATEPPAEGPAGSS